MDDATVGASHYLPEVHGRNPELLKEAAIQVVELALERDAPPQPAGDEHDLRGAHAEERQVPEERVGGARVRPGPHREAEEARRQEGEQVEVSVEAAARHQAEEDEDVGEVEDGALRDGPPLLTHRLGLPGVLHREVHRLEVWGLHGHESSKWE